MKDFGYDVADYRDVDPIFGTLADFDALVARAHALGLKVIIDQVYATPRTSMPGSPRAARTATNPHADWYVWADAKPDGSPPNNWQSVFGGPAWTWDARRGQYYLHNFLPRTAAAQRPPSRRCRTHCSTTARFWLDRGRRRLPARCDQLRDARSGADR